MKSTLSGETKRLACFGDQQGGNVCPLCRPGRQRVPWLCSLNPKLGRTVRQQDRLDWTWTWDWPRVLRLSRPCGCKVQDVSQALGVLSAPAPSREDPGDALGAAHGRPSSAAPRVVALGHPGDRPAPKLQAPPWAGCPSQVPPCPKAGLPRGPRASVCPFLPLLRASEEPGAQTPLSPASPTPPPCFYLSPGGVWGQLGTPVGTQPFLETQGYPSLK